VETRATTTKSLLGRGALRPRPSFEGGGGGPPPPHPRGGGGGRGAAGGRGGGGGGRPAPPPPPPTSRVERFVGLGQSRLFGRRGSSSENTREEAGRPDACARARRRSPPQRVASVAHERAQREEAVHFRRLPLNRS
jgi:hypothetical protein